MREVQSDHQGGEGSHGWGAENGGKTGNLSDYAGELEANVRRILIDKEEETSKKDLKKQLVKKLDKNENMVIVNGLATSCEDSDNPSLKRSPESRLPDDALSLKF